MYGFCIGGAVFIVIYYLPIYFQAVRGVSATTSAVHTLPLIVSQLIGNVVTGAAISRIGYFMPFVWAACVLMPIGAGLLTTLAADEPTGKWIGYQILFGLGVGAGFQQVAVSVQTAFPVQDIAVAVAVVLSAQLLGGAVMLSAAESVFNDHLRGSIAALRIPGFDVNDIARTGATQVTKAIPARYLPAVLTAYDHAVTKVFQVSLIMACLMSLGACGMEWRSVKKEEKMEKAVEA